MSLRTDDCLLADQVARNPERSSATAGRGPTAIAQRERWKWLIGEQESEVVGPDARHPTRR